MFTVLLSTIGSGVICGMHGIHLGTGVTGRVGGELIAVGHMTGIGITAIRTIVIITGVRSVRGALFTTATTTYTAV